MRSTLAHEKMAGYTKFVTLPKDLENESRAQSFRKRLVEAKLIDSGWLARSRAPNGANRKLKFIDVWQHYQKDHLLTLTEAARVLKQFRCTRFLPPLFELRMSEMTPQVISEFIRSSKEQALLKPNSHRFNFEKELRDLRSIFNWHKDNIDYQFVNPVNSSHYKLAVISEIPRVERQISLEQIQKFLSHLPDFYRDVATMAFYCGARIGEIAGLHWKNIDFDRRVLKIQEVMVWIHSKSPQVKATPKNGESREVYINDTMLEILKRHQLVRRDSPLVFHRQGKPLTYTIIHGDFNRAWKRAGLSQYKGCHILRYGSSQGSRRLTGSIDGAKAVTGHKSMALAHQYSNFNSIDQNRDAVEKLEQAMKPQASLP